MAYTRLLRAYYRTERPIPCDQAYRLSRASSKAQRAAVDSVLREFFTQQGDCWHNKRADEEIAAYQAQAETNRRIANTRKGQRTVHESSHEPNNEPSTNRTPNHKPDTRYQNQEPETSKSNTLSGKPDASALKLEKLNGYRVQAREILIFLNEKTGKAFEPVDANLELVIARLKEATPDDIRAVVAMKCREWGADENMMRCLRPKTLFSRTNFAQYKGELKS